MTVQTYHFAPRGSRFTSEVRFCPQDGSELQPVPETSQPLDPLIGKTIDGRYRIDSTLGAGGMGVVYRARQHSPQRTVALKVTRASLASPNARRRFELETELLARPEHLSLIHI